jgi:two-component system phosphate regulon sensor histidine kinase PhoR
LPQVILLGLLVVVQFLWIYRAAKMQEKQFESTVILAMNKVVEQLVLQKEICSEVKTCQMLNNLPCNCQSVLSQKQWKILDSIVAAELIQNHIKIEYELILSTVPHPNCVKSKLHKCFAIKTEIKTMKGEDLWLHVAFPGRNAFIVAQIGGLFLVSMVLIVLTLLVFFRIYAYYKAEWSIAHDTRNFINNMTHELKTPVASIKLANSRIKKQLPDPAQFGMFTQIIDQESSKLDKMASYLLDASKLQRGYMAPVLVPIDIIPLVREQVELFRLQVDEKKGTISLQSDAENTRIMGDCFQISLAIGNLIDNAVKYSPGKPEILVVISNKTQRLLIEVADKGIGIDKEDQKMIFNEFSRVDTGNLHVVKGFGLGLTFVWHMF